VKADIHPQLHLVHVRCACGNEFETRSTKDEVHLEICGACHPFFSGKQKLIDTAGRVERFQRRQAASEAARSAQAAQKAAAAAKKSAPAKKK